MLGLMLIGAVLLYLLLWIGATVWIYRWAKRRGYSKTRSGIAAFVAFFALWLLVFWDWIPTVAAHKSHCEKEGGFFVHKSLEQWQKENPGVVETLTPYADLKDKSLPHYYGMPYRELPGTRYNVYWLNERIYYHSDLERDITKPFPVHKWTSFLADSKTDTKLAEFVYFTSGYPNAMTTGGLSGFKFWLAYSGCAGEHMEIATREYKKFQNDAIHLGEKK